MNHKNHFHHVNHSLGIWLRFLAWFCPPSLYEGIEGDLMEQFEEDLKASDGCKPSDAYRKARRKFVWNVIRFFHPEIFLRNRFHLTLIQNFMIGNYFKVALRVMLRNKPIHPSTSWG